MDQRALDGWVATGGFPACIDCVSTARKREIHALKRIPPRPFELRLEECREKKQEELHDLERTQRRLLRESKQRGEDRVMADAP